MLNTFPVFRIDKSRMTAPESEVIVQPMFNGPLFEQMKEIKFEFELQSGKELLHAE